MGSRSAQSSHDVLRSAGVAIDTDRAVPVDLFRASCSAYQTVPTCSDSDTSGVFVRAA